MSSPSTRPRRPAELFRLFGQVALAGIGGGLPAHARRMLTDKGWLSELDFAECFTLAQLTPGPNAVNLAAMVGVRLGGWWGAAAAVTGILLPGLAVMLSAAALTLGLPKGLPPTLQSALRGAACAALGVMLSAALPVVRVSLGARGGWALAALTLLGLGVLRWPLLPVLLGVVALGLWLNRPQQGAADDL